MSAPYTNIRHPWNIDRDNHEGITVKDDGGDIVYEENYRDFPSEWKGVMRERVIEKCRENAYFMVEASRSYKRIS